MKQHLSGKNAVITGSSMGIGKAIALEFARQGANVVVNSSASESAIDATVHEIVAMGGKAVGFCGSVADYATAGKLIDSCVSSFGNIDILVNVAGIAEPVGSTILDIAPSDWQRLIDVHLHGTFNTCRHAAPLMAEQKKGVIINTASHALLGIFGGTGYGAAKGATMSLSWELAMDLKEHGIRCNVVCPGAETRLSTGPDYEAIIEGLYKRGLLNDDMKNASLNPIPAKFLAPTYAFLASDLAGNVTGKMFTAAGGYVGLWGIAPEQFIAYKDHADGSLWQLEDLAQEFKNAGLL